MQELEKNNHNKALVVLAIYTLTIFIYKDFGIPNVLGYLFLIAAAMYIIFYEKASAKINNISVAFALLIFFQIAEIIRSILMGNHTHQMYIAAFILVAFFVFVSDAKERDVKLTIKMWKGLSIALSFYVILVAAMPSIYVKLINPVLSKASQEMNINYLSGGYGIAIGGNIIIIDYIVAFAFLYYVCAFLINRDEGRLYRVKCLIPALFILLAVFLINRKTEIIAILIAAAYMFFSKVTFRSFKQKKKNIRFFLLIFIAMMLFAFLLYRTGHLGRLGDFIETVLANKRTGANRDISSGRMLFWGIALNLFLHYPILGIGWGNFAEHIPASSQSIGIEKHNVHNCYLQVLCETGIVGFILFYGCIGYIFAKIAKKSIEMSRGSYDTDMLIINSTCVAYQLMFLICAAIDPTFYSVVFWLLYSLSIMLSNSINKQFALNEK